MKALFYNGPEHGKEMEIPSPPNTVILVEKKPDFSKWAQADFSIPDPIEVFHHQYYLLSWQKHCATYFFDH